MSFKEEARNKLFEGVTLLADAVVTTLSPKGRNVAIHRTWGMPIVVHDGVTVAREVDSRDPLVKIGIDLVREAAQKTNEEAGDGTTTATLLAYELIKGGLELIKKGENPMTLRTQIYKALPDLLKELKRLSKPVKTKAEIAHVAFISSADKEIGDLVAEAVEKVGTDGMVTCEEGKGLKNEVEYTDGMQFNKGYLSSYFVTNPGRMEATIEDPYIVLLPKELSINNEIVPILENLAKTSKNIVIIADDIKGDALATMAVNKMKGNINIVGIMCPGIGDKTSYYNDIAILTGGKVLSAQSGLVPTNGTDWAGRADRVVVSRDTTVIIGGRGDKKQIEKYQESMRKQIEDEKSDYEREKIEDRLARLSTGVAVIKVGAKTEIDMREKLERVKDAIGSATAARDEGTVVGGGSVFVQLSKVLDPHLPADKLLWGILQSPIRKIMENSGESAVKIEKALEEVKNDKTGSLGYNCELGYIEDLRISGVIDPAKVVRLALENAIGVGTSILTTDCTIAIQLEEDDRKPQS